MRIHIVDNSLRQNYMKTCGLPEEMANQAVRTISSQSDITKPSFLKTKPKRELESAHGVNFRPLNIISGQKVIQKNPQKQSGVFQSKSRQNINTWTRKIIDNYNVECASIATVSHSQSTLITEKGNQTSSFNSVGLENKNRSKTAGKGRRPDI